MSEFNPQEHFRKLQGKDYLEVKWRLVWFREEHPDWCINTLLIEHDTVNHAAVFKADIVDKDGKVLAQGHGSECIKDFKDYLEKAETKSIGRALAILGYGTQFAEELDEGDRIVDAPVEPKAKPAPAKAPEKPAQKEPIYKCTDCGKILADTKVGDSIIKRDVIIASTTKAFGRCLCTDCAAKAKAEKAAKKGAQ